MNDCDCYAKFCLTVSSLGWLINGAEKVHSSECRKRIISVI